MGSLNVLENKKGPEAEADEADEADEAEAILSGHHRLKTPRPHSFCRSEELINKSPELRLNLSRS